MIEIEHCRKILQGPNLTDEDIHEIRAFLYQFITEIIEDQIQSSKNIKQTYSENETSSGKKLY